MRSFIGILRWSEPQEAPSTSRFLAGLDRSFATIPVWIVSQSDTLCRSDARRMLWILIGHGFPLVDFFHCGFPPADEIGKQHNGE